MSKPGRRAGLNVYKNKKMYYVYVIESQKNLDLYKGFTSDINQRIKNHNDGLTQSTKNGRPWKLIYCEIFSNKQDAIERERYLNKVLKNYFKNRNIK